MAKDASNLASFYCSHIDGIVCVKQIGLGLAKTLKKCKNFVRMSSDFNFTVVSRFLGNVCVKPCFNTQGEGGGASPDLSRSFHPLLPKKRQKMEHNFDVIIIALTISI